MRKGLRYAVLASAILLLLNLASLFIAPYSQSRYDDIRQLIFSLYWRSDNFRSFDRFC